MFIPVGQSDFTLHISLSNNPRQLAFANASYERFESRETLTFIRGNCDQGPLAGAPARLVVMQRAGPAENAFDIALSGALTSLPALCFAHQDRSIFLRGDRAHRAARHSRPPLYTAHRERPLPSAKLLSRCIIAPVTHELAQYDLRAKYFLRVLQRAPRCSAVILFAPARRGARALLHR